ncbi:MAG: chemotaxis response regulator protein-glutamate methylesterase [Planctomycetaceae bacterium]|uniref:Protein-glutamate methylesterase/protein-glutamine glutaminase n=1 Tax=Lacipirellula limnantheis TaxID=2528024 RepID=A0A517TXM5_9BACT|nr:chemotaxis response regulator protein-glutamate methylesterase [Lacipirellula limnantheis]MBL9162732.1 chemotaxis response regulator protein-glutamate methylesterase [Planctomycetaceae bacterium]QDT73129.1 Chemotaxis response regulator protein-glutamate methylesterase [Lacipirellula limnantheis]
MEKIRVLVVDDSIVVRRVVMEELEAQADIEVAGSASTGRMALEKMNQLNPDLVVLDIEMPDMDGLTALTHLRGSHPATPVVMFSSLTELGAAATLEALSRGASDFFAKPGGPGGLEASRQIIRAELIPSIRALCASKPPSPPNREKTPTTPRPSRPIASNARIDVLAIGASTGGPNALAEIFTLLPPSLPVPIVVVQHMPPMFTHMLAERLSKNSQISTVEAKSGSELEPGKAWVAPGDHHLILVREGQRIRTKINQEPPENACRPAVDPLFRSVASLYGANCLAVVLTGMGQDGLRGCEAIRAAGGQILTQDEATSVVWGMPGFVARAGLADRVLPLPMMAGEIVRRIRGGRG